MEPFFIASCSPRRGGNSDFAAELLQETLPGPVVLRRIADAHVLPCSSCGYCDTHPGRCALDGSAGEAWGDGASGLFRATCAAPFTFVVSPVYFYHLPAQAKAWIDRSQRFWSWKGVKPGQGKGLTAVLMGARMKGDKLFEGAERTLRYMAQALGMEWHEPLRLYGLDGADALAGCPEKQELVRSFAAGRFGEFSL